MTLPIPNPQGRLVYGESTTHAQGSGSAYSSPSSNADCPKQGSHGLLAKSRTSLIPSATPCSSIVSRENSRPQRYAWGATRVTPWENRGSCEGCLRTSGDLSKHVLSHDRFPPRQSATVPPMPRFGLMDAFSFDASVETCRFGHLLAQLAVSPGFILRPSLSDSHGIRSRRRSLVSPGFILRPSLSALAAPHDHVRVRLCRRGSYSGLR